MNSVCLLNFIDGRIPLQSQDCVVFNHCSGNKKKALAKLSGALYFVYIYIYWKRMTFANSDLL